MAKKIAKIEEAKQILAAVGIPKPTVSTPYSLLALAGIKKTYSWSDATNEWMTIRNVMDFMASEYKKSMHRIRGKALESRVCIP